MERWAHNQATPLCAACDTVYDVCRFCRADSARAGKGGGKPGRHDGLRIIEHHFVPFRGKGSGTPNGQRQAPQGGGGDQGSAPKEVRNQTERGPDEAFETKDGRRVHGPAPPPVLLAELEAEQRLNKAK